MARTGRLMSVAELAGFNCKRKSGAKPANLDAAANCADSPLFGCPMAFSTLAAAPALRLAARRVT